jgi:hypothetical protein
VQLAARLCSRADPGGILVPGRLLDADQGRTLVRRRVVSRSGLKRYHPGNTCVIRAEYYRRQCRGLWPICTTRLSRNAEDVTNTQPLPARVEDAADTKQYSLAKILAIWASVTVPMGVLAWVVGPAIIPHTSLHPGLVHWMLMVVGMMWQFVVSLAVLRHELGHLCQARDHRLLAHLRQGARALRRRVIVVWRICTMAISSAPRRAAR